MSGPSWRSTPFDFAAAPRSCSRSKVPTFGISLSMMNLRIDITHLADMTLNKQPLIRGIWQHESCTPKRVGLGRLCGQSLLEKLDLSLRYPGRAGQGPFLHRTVEAWYYASIA